MKKILITLLLLSAMNTFASSSEKNGLIKGAALGFVNGLEFSEDATDSETFNTYSIESIRYGRGVRSFVTIKITKQSIKYGHSISCKFEVVSVTYQINKVTFLDLDKSEECELMDSVN